MEFVADTAYFPGDSLGLFAKLNTPHRQADARKKGWTPRPPDPTHPCGESRRTIIARDGVLYSMLS